MTLVVVVMGTSCVLRDSLGIIGIAMGTKDT